MSVWITTAQIKTMNSIIDRKGSLVISADGGSIFGGHGVLSRYFKVVLTGDHKWKLTKKDSMDRLDPEIRSEIQAQLLAINDDPNSDVEVRIEDAEKLFGDPRWVIEYNNHLDGNPMEHHIDREQLISQVEAAQDDYARLYTQFVELYGEKLQRRVDDHLAGKLCNIPELIPNDEQGRITLLNDLTDQFEDQLLALRLDTRDSLILTDEEYSGFVDHRWDNSKRLKESIERLERMA
jgi:hypothetical protein